MPIHIQFIIKTLRAICGTYFVSGWNESFRYTSESCLKLDILNFGQNFPKKQFWLGKRSEINYIAIVILSILPCLRQHRFSKLWSSFYL